MNAVCGTARTVLWEATGYIPSPTRFNKYFLSS